MISLRTVLDIVSSEFGVSHGEILSPSRKIPVCKARACVAMLLYELTERTLTDIAECLCRKDHTSAKHWIDRMTSAHQTEKKLWEAYKRCEESLTRWDQVGN